jgi:pimeloyl-ACP methyl ester carboxylesterase
MQVVINDQIINYDMSGSGKTVVLVHGWADSLATFYDLKSSLSKNYEVVSLDLPGFGQSSMISEAWGLDEYSKFLADFVKKLKLEVYCYIGHSNGGAILINGLSSSKLSAKKLVLLSSAGIRNQKKVKKQILKVAAKSGKAVTAILPSNTRDSIRKRCYGAIGSDLLVSPHMEETFKRVVEQDVQVQAKKIKMPALLIYGNEDSATPPEFGETFTDLIAGSRLFRIDHAGHFIHHDQPAHVKKLIEDFLK